MTKDPKEKRPAISTIQTSNELKRWYWLKAELVAQAKSVGVKTTGGKFAILDRIGHFLDSGETDWPGDVKTKTLSGFDWHKDALSRETIITDSYKNSQNVRRFFLAHAGKDFKFNIAFMDWIRRNRGKTLADAIVEYHRLRGASSARGFQTKIKPHNQFNQYTRDILADNPGLGMDDVRRIWQLKRALPSENGRHEYARSDLALDIDRDEEPQA